MERKLRVTRQAFLAVLLALGLSLVPATPAAAADLPTVSPETADYDLDDRAELLFTFELGVATSIVKVTDDVGNLTRGLSYDYIVLEKHLIILNKYLNAKLKDIGHQVTLIVHFDVGAVVLTITAIGSPPSIDPLSAEYDLDDAGNVSTTIIWGAADKVELVMDDEGGTLRSNIDYQVVPITAYRAELRVSHTNYLRHALKDIGDSLELTIMFNRGAPVTFDIAAIGTHPTVQHETREYSLDAPANVTNTITYGAATTVVSVKDDEGRTLTRPAQYTFTSVGDGKAALTISHWNYLRNVLEDIGDSVQLTIECDRGDPVTFQMVAGGTQPSVSPTTADYDLTSPGHVQTTITWGAAGGVASITGNGSPLAAASHYTVGATVGGQATLTVLNGYLAGKLTDIGDTVVLTVAFDVGADATFTISAAGVHPTIAPTSAEYDLDDPQNVQTTITWGAATGVDSITGNGSLLTAGSHYTVGATVAGQATLTILNDYLADRLTDIDQTVALTIAFDVGADVTFTIKAGGVHPTISPASAEYDLDNRQDIETTVTWETASSINRIRDGDGYELSRPADYVVTDIGGGQARLTVRDSYLRGKLNDVGATLNLTIDFDYGVDRVFAITATGVRPSISPASRVFDYDSPDHLRTTVTWGSASRIESIVDGGGYELVKNIDYSFDDATRVLTIRESFIKETKRMDIGDSLRLTIDFDVNDATFDITATGTHPSIAPPRAEYDIIDQPNVTTTITWGSATQVDSIVDGDGYTLRKGVDYEVVDIDGAYANLVIYGRGGDYLSRKLRNFRQQVELTVGFNVGNDGTFTVSALNPCFIATAAYGSPMAEEIAVLREFRDKCMLTNPVGQVLVDLYYRNSPPIAQFITEHQSLRPIVRGALLPAVAMSSVAVNPALAEGMAIVGLLALAAAALAVWTIRRRGRRPEYR
ncbi:MAG: X2-like carbohydrate binding domain-containing protein [Dehalococcoidia bacterium]